MVNATGRYLVVNTLPGETTMFDLTRSTQWHLSSTGPMSSLSPSGRTAMMVHGERAAIVHFDLPDDPAQLRDWVVHATSYTADAIGP